MDTPDQRLRDAETFGQRIGQSTRKIARETAAEVAGDLVRAALPTDTETFARQDAALRSQARTVLAEQFGAQIGNEELARQQADLDLAARIELATATAQDAAAALAALIGEAQARTDATQQALAQTDAVARAAQAAAAAADAKADQALAASKPAPVPKGAIRPGDFFGQFDAKRAYVKGSLVISETGTQFIASRDIKPGERLPTAPNDKQNPWKPTAENTSASTPSVGAAAAIRAAVYPPMFWQDTAPPAGIGNAYTVWGSGIDPQAHVRTWIDTTRMAMLSAIEDDSGAWVWVGVNARPAP
jgi:hypothetical protein